MSEEQEKIEEDYEKALASTVKGIIKEEFGDSPVVCSVGVNDKGVIRIDCEEDRR